MKKNQLTFLVILVYFTLTANSLFAQTSMAHTLAILDHGSYIRPNTEFVQTYERVMNQLDRKFSETKQQIGDMTVKVQNMLEEDRIFQTNLSIMQAINSIERPTRTYNVYVAYYLTYRQSGYNHVTAARALNNL